MLKYDQDENVINKNQKTNDSDEMMTSPHQKLQLLVLCAHPKHRVPLAYDLSQSTSKIANPIHNKWKKKKRRSILTHTID